MRKFEKKESRLFFQTRDVIMAHKYAGYVFNYLTRKIKPRNFADHTRQSYYVQSK